MEIKATNNMYINIVPQRGGWSTSEEGGGGVGVPQSRGWSTSEVGLEYLRERGGVPQRGGGVEYFRWGGG